MTEPWDAAWWLAEVADDPSFAEEVLPLLIDVLAPEPEHLYLDLGCGEGQGMRTIAAAGARAVGCDLDQTLLGHARSAGPVVRGRLPGLEWLATAAVDGAYAVLVLEHLEEIARLWEETARVVRPGGVMAVVANHPVFTAPGAGPLIDPTDGEVTWRWGRYLEPGVSVEPAGSFNLAMHHRSLGTLLSGAAAAGWRVERLIERGPGEAASARDPLLAAQRHIPRLVGVRLQNTSGS